jgi:threonine synthase
LTFTCSGCGSSIDGLSGGPHFKCPESDSKLEVDHVLQPTQHVGAALIADLTERNDEANEGSSSPFIKYRSLLYPYRAALSLGLTDSEYCQIVTNLNSAIAEIDPNGVGFEETPLTFDKSNNLFVKDETRNVAQSHKARHLFNVMVYLLVLEKGEKSPGNESLRSKRLAVASCGNAGLAAATIARAAKWEIDVCVPPSASPVVLEKLKTLGATIHMCDRDSTISTPKGEVSTAGEGDPCVTAFRNLVEVQGGLPFSVQGTECGIAAEGGQTLAWEIMEVSSSLRRIVVVLFIFISPFLTQITLSSHFTN